LAIAIPLFVLSSFDAVLQHAAKKERGGRKEGEREKRARTWERQQA